MVTGTDDKELEQMEADIERKRAEEEKKADVQSAPEQPSESHEAPPEQSGEESSGESGQDQKPPDQGKNFDAKEWVKKKGWKTTEDAAHSLRELEQKYHQQNQELAKMKNGYPQTGYPMPPQAPPPPPPPNYPDYRNPGAYQPPPNPYGGYNAPPRYQEPIQPIQPLPELNNRQYEEAARMYNMTTEDFRRVYNLQKDMIDTAYKRFQNENETWRNEWASQNERQSDMAKVMADPSFHFPDVQAEMHDIFSKNPSLWNDKRPWSNAMNTALMNIGRRSFTGGQPGPSNHYPSTPPNMAGGNRGSSLPPSARRVQMPTMKELQGKSVEEIEKILRSQGKIKEWE